MPEKIKTFILDGGGTDLVCISPEYLLETLRVELDGSEPEGEGPENAIEFTVRIERTLTKEECDNLPEWDGF